MGEGTDATREHTRVSTHTCQPYEEAMGTYWIQERGGFMAKFGGQSKSATRRIDWSDREVLMRQREVIQHINKTRKIQKCLSVVLYAIEHSNKITQNFPPGVSKPDLPQMDADGKFLLRQCRRLAGEDLSGEQAPRRVSKAPQISKSHTNKIWLQTSNHTPTKLPPSPAQSRQTAQAWRRGAGPRTEP